MQFFQQLTLAAALLLVTASSTLATPAVLEGAALQDVLAQESTASLSIGHHHLEVSGSCDSPGLEKSSSDNELINADSRTFS